MLADVESNKISHCLGKSEDRDSQAVRVLGVSVSAGPQVRPRPAVPRLAAHRAGERCLLEVTWLLHPLEQLESKPA